MENYVETFQSSKLNLFSSCLTVYDSPVKIVWLQAVVFSKHGILQFSGNDHLFKYYPEKVPLNWFNYFNCSKQTCIQVSKFSFALEECHFQ